MNPPTPRGSRSNRFLAIVAVALLLGVGGASTVASLDNPLTASETPAEDGVWLEPVDGEVPAINMALTPDGEVVYYSGIEAKGHDHGPTDDPDHIHPTSWTFFTTKPNRSTSRVFDPATGEVTTPTDDPITDLFCSGTTVRPDGSVMALGGSDWRTLPDQGNPVKGTDETYLLDPSTDDWDRGPNLTINRWYPSVIEMPDGDALALAGIKNLSDPSTHNAYMEELERNGDTWERIEPKVQLADGVTVEHQGSFGEREAAVMNLPMYPRAFVVGGGPHEGDVVYTSNGDLWAPFGERPEEALWGTIQTYDRSSETWTVHGPSVFGARQLGASVPLLLDPARGYAPEVLSFGGSLERSGAATPTAELLDLSSEEPQAEAVDPMHEPRWHVNGVLLPSGDVLAVGGGHFDSVVLYGARNSYAMSAELYDPDTGTWEELAEMTVPRGYHSTAVLLPDGRVLVGGNVPLPWPPQDIEERVYGQIVENRLEVFEPPYLHTGEDSRPSITGISNNPNDEAQEAAVANLTYGQSFSVTVTGVDEGLDRVVLVRPGATTHGFDADQRGILLNVTSHDLDAQGDGTLTLTAPPNGNVAPPGHYMLFVNEDVDGTSVPSVSHFVNLDAS